MATKMAANEPHGTIFRNGNIFFCTLQTLRIQEMSIKKMCSGGAWGPYLPTRLVDIQTFCSGGCRYNCICTYSGADNNKHIIRIAQMTQVDILKPWIK